MTPTDYELFDRLRKGPRGTERWPVERLATMTREEIVAALAEQESRCPACRGTGGGQYNNCPTCDGNGVIG